MKMASEEKVKQYIAYWFQLGKKVLLGKNKESLFPQPIFEGNSYSSAFESCWQRIIASDKEDCYLEGTEQTIQELLTPAWDIISCARCSMPVPIKELGIQAPSCPCSDLNNWPNNELPQPRFSADNRNYLDRIKMRLLQDKEV
jgi:hypothetical protein